MRAGDMLGGRAEWLANNYGPDSPYAASAWRLEEGALWDVGPHALSHLLPVLGPVVAVTGARGAGDLVHLVLNHEGGAVSVMSLCLTMPPAASRVGVEMFDESGWHVRPDLARDTDAAYRNALSALLANAAAGETRHRCDVRFGRDVVDVLSRCQQVLDAPRPGLTAPENTPRRHLVWSGPRRGVILSGQDGIEASLVHDDVTPRRSRVGTS
jgi:hypothetical protein